MQTLNDDERRLVLGEVLMDELKAIHEYVRVIPDVQDKLHQVHVKVDSMHNRFIVIEHIVKEHEAEIKAIKTKIA